MKRILIVFSLLLACISHSSGQYRVLLTKGNSIDASGVEIRDQTVSLTTTQGSQIVDKTDILCIIPTSGKPFTFREKNQKKMKILKRDVKNDYRGSDIPRILAYKYHKGNVDIGQLYRLNPESGLTEPEFEAAFIRQQKQFKKRSIISGSIIGFMLIISTALVITTAAEASQFL